MGRSRNKNGRRKDCKNGFKQKLLHHKTSGKTKNQMDGCSPEGCITTPGDKRMEEKSENMDEWRHLMREAKAWKEIWNGWKDGIYSSLEVHIPQCAGLHTSLISHFNISFSNSLLVAMQICYPQHHFTDHSQLSQATLSTEYGSMLPCIMVWGMKWILTSIKNVPFFY